MSILKSIMHHWNKTTNNYDILHPETESSQITDWHSSIIASLASKTLGTVVDAITTDSVLGKLIKMLLDASGVKYLIDTNGYVCFGSLFGGLIIQWIYADITSSANTIRYPITMSSTLTAIAVDVEPVPSLVKTIGISTWSGSTLTVAPVDYHAITIWVIGV